MIPIVPISARKLKKYYIIKTDIDCAYCTYKHLHLSDGYYNKLIDLPNLYFNKKILEKAFTRRKRIKWMNQKIPLTETPKQIFVFSFFPAYLKFKSRNVTIYSIFKSKSEYLKWKLRS